MYILSTNRLLLREFSPSDAQVMFDLNSDPEVMQYTGDITFDTVQETKEFIASYPDYEQNGFGRWWVIRKEDKEILGWCGLKIVKGETDIGYRFFKKYWNQGYATESAFACLDYGFNVLNLNEIVANADKANAGSVKVLEKIGMQFEKEQSYDSLKKAVRYKITKNEFLQKS